MIPVYLQNALIKELKELFTGYKLINSKRDLVNINIYPQRLPIRKKDDDSTPFPYILVCLEEGEVDNDDNTVKIYFIIGIHDPNENGQGDMDVLNIIQTIYQHLFHKKIIDDMYEINFPFKWALQDEDTFPKYFGGIETNWNVGVMMQKEDEFI